MNKHNVVELSGRDASRDELTELIRDGARKLIGEALEAEVSELLSEFSQRRDEGGRATVVRNGALKSTPAQPFTWRSKNPSVTNGASVTDDASVPATSITVPESEIAMRRRSAPVSTDVSVYSRASFSIILKAASVFDEQRGRLLIQKNRRIRMAA